MKYNKFIYFLVVLIFCINTTIAQSVSKYQKIKRVGDDKFNYQEWVVTKSGNELKMVFSDRDQNFFYKSYYVQEKLKNTNFMKPLYVINEKENAYEVVVANPEQVGKPKGLFSMFFMGTNTFKDSKNVEYLGWIPKENVLNYNHSFLEPSNNKPIKYKLGTYSVDRLFDLEPHMEVDSVFLFKDPFLKVKQDKKLISNQIVYPYKYNTTKKSVLISNSPVVKDSTNQIMGWVRSDLITRIGQNKVHIINDNHKLYTFNGRDTIAVVRNDVFSRYLYAKTNLKENELDTLVAPLHVWDHSQNKLINVKGESFYTKEIKIIKEESKVVNVHFICDVNGKSLKTILNSLQNLYISLFEKPGDYKYYFSAILINKNGQRILKKTDSFVKWIDFIESFVNESLQTNFYYQEKMSISKAINYCFDNFLNPDKRFENNLFIISSNREKVKFGEQEDYFFERLAKKSSKVLFVQLNNKMTPGFQNFLLGSKQFLYKTGAFYNKFIENFIIDNEILIADNSLKNISSDEDNIYVYDAPDRSLFNGGIVFPKINKSLTPLSLEITIDTLLKRTDLTNEKLISSLVYYDKKLGVLRSKPSKLTDKIYHRHFTDTLDVNSLSRNNLHEVLYPKVGLLNDSIPKTGYLMTKDEIISLIDDFRNTFPLIRKPVTRKKRRVIKKLSLRLMKILNKSALRRVLNRKATLADLFYYKSGIPLHHKGYYCLRVTKLPRKRIGKSGFEDFYIRQYKKMNKFEELFLKNKLLKVKKGFQQDIYFVPEELLP